MSKSELFTLEEDRVRFGEVSELESFETDELLSAMGVNNAPKSASGKTGG